MSKRYLVVLTETELHALRGGARLAIEEGSPPRALESAVAKLNAATPASGAAASLTDPQWWMVSRALDNLYGGVAGSPDAVQRAEARQIERVIAALKPVIFAVAGRRLSRSRAS